MADLQMRPRFVVPLRCDQQTVVDTLREHVGDAEPPLEGSFESSHCVLRIPETRRAFWSPELDLTFEPIESEDELPSSGIRVRCLFTPRPGVWTGFAFVYAALGAVGLVAGMYGVAQLTLGQTPEGLAAALGALLLIAGIYAASFIGQGLAAQQMYELRAFLGSGLDRAEEKASARAGTPMDRAGL